MTRRVWLDALVGLGGFVLGAVLAVLALEAGWRFGFWLAQGGAL